MLCLKVREAKRAADAAVEKEMVEQWMCDPRMMPGWTVHFSAKHSESGGVVDTQAIAQ
jgi:hypothetical protein